VNETRRSVRPHELLFLSPCLCRSFEYAIWTKAVDFGFNMRLERSSMMFSVAFGTEDDIPVSNETKSWLLSNLDVRLSASAVRMARQRS
jgi:hypothetical protein